jgi:hypothetical protein
VWREDSIRLSIHGPLFSVVEVTVDLSFKNRDSRWSASNVRVTGFFEEVLDDPEGWIPPDMITISLHTEGYYPQWLVEWIAKQLPEVS